jgi:hypothetical protein
MEQHRNDQSNNGKFNYRWRAQTLSSEWFFSRESDRAARELPVCVTKIDASNALSYERVMPACYIIFRVGTRATSIENLSSRST